MRSQTASKKLIHKITEEYYNLATESLPKTMIEELDIKVDLLQPIVKDNFSLMESLIINFRAFLHFNSVNDNLDNLFNELKVIKEKLPLSFKNKLDTYKAIFVQDDIGMFLYFSKAFPFAEWHDIQFLIEIIRLDFKYDTDNSVAFYECLLKHHFQSEKDKKNIEKEKVDYYERKRKKSIEEVSDQINKEIKRTIIKKEIGPDDNKQRNIVSKRPESKRNERIRKHLMETGNVQEREPKDKEI